jgi:monofunctional biosynthetic peptidoglycan transglycosylase
MFRILMRLLWRVLRAFMLLSIALVLLFRWVQPPGSALMLERKAEALLQGKTLTLNQQWVDWRQLPDNLKMSVIASEDQHFATHWGFDFNAIQQAFEHNEHSRELRGASTISQQVAKNLFLWPGRSWLRKGLESWFTLCMELLWPKQRILEVYLNTAEWGDGVFGAEAAARHYFNRPAATLSNEQASLMAATLPNPRDWSPSDPGNFVQRRASWIRRQIIQLGGSDYLQHLDDRRPL